MLSKQIIPLVAESINNRPRRLANSSPKEQYFIQEFRDRLSRELGMIVDVTFAVREAEKQLLTVGFMPTDEIGAEICLDIAKQVASDLWKESNYLFHTHVTITGIPDGGVFLLYEFNQAFEIATALKVADFATIRQAYFSCLFFATYENTMQAEKWFQALLTFSNQCINNGSWRTALLCLDEAEHLLAYFFSRFEYYSVGKLVYLFIKLGDAFEFADLPERSVNLAKKCVPLLEEFDNPAAPDHISFQTMEQKILSWQTASEEHWQNNAPVLLAGKAFAEKIR